MGAHRVTEGGEELHRIRVVHRLELGMPLGSEGEGLGLAHRDGLDDAIWRRGFHRETRCKALDALAMDRVHHGLALAEDLLQHAARTNVDDMGWRVAHVDVVVLRRAVVEAALVALQFGLERATHDHVQFLKAAADAEQGNAAFDGAGDEPQRELVARMVIGFVIGGGLLAIVRRMDVRDRAGHQDAVETVEQGIEMQRIHDGGIMTGVQFDTSATARTYLSPIEWNRKP